MARPSSVRTLACKFFDVYCGGTTRFTELVSCFGRFKQILRIPSRHKLLATRSSLLSLQQQANQSQPTAGLLSCPVRSHSVQDLLVFRLCMSSEERHTAKCQSRKEGLVVQTRQIDVYLFHLGPPPVCRRNEMTTHEFCG